MKRGSAILLAAALALLCLILPGFYNGLRTVHYAVPAGFSRSVRIALVTDLHSCDYGPGQRRLIDALDAASPDLVLLGGDIFDDDLPDDNTETFIAGVAGRYPCYYVTGNHEFWSGAAAFDVKMGILEKYGVTRLSGDVVPLEIHGQRFTLCGVDDPYAWPSGAPNYRAEVRRMIESAGDTFTILLAHRPEIFEFYARIGIDLVLSGHAHGGQWRIPGLLNGLFAPNQGLFPKYAGGRYESGNTTMIVSRGLALESTPVPRFYNRPELVIVDLQ